MNSNDISPTTLALDPATVALATAHIKWCGVGRTLPGVRLAAAIVAVAAERKAAEQAAFEEALADLRAREIAKERLTALRAATVVAAPGSRRAKGKRARAAAREAYGTGRVAA